MPKQDKIDADYCLSCGTPLLYPSMPCPKCSSKNAAEASTGTKREPYRIDTTVRGHIESLVSSKEKVYFTLAVVVSLLTYLMLLFSVVGILYSVGFMLVLLVLQGLMIGEIRCNGVKVTAKQFPELYEKTVRMSQMLGLKQVPDVYVVQAGGVLNALTTKFLSRNFVIMFSDVLEIGYKEGDKVVEFILGHELVHIYRKHVQHRMFLLPGMFTPFLGKAYSRACEYTCDKISAHLQPAGAVQGLLVLAAGKELYKKVNPLEFVAQAQNESGFWTWLAEIFSTHPSLFNRVSEVIKSSNCSK